MTSPQVFEGALILRQWIHTQGLQETTQVFHSLDELYALCLAVSAPQVVDRIVIHGQDAEAKRRVVTFVFQSITVSQAPVSS